MNIKTTAVVTAISFFCLAGTAMAEVQQSQAPESTSFIQSDESAEFAAYEFETDSVKNETDTLTIKRSSSADDIHEWNPEDWSEIP